MGAMHVHADYRADFCAGREHSDAIVSIVGILMQFLSLLSLCVRLLALFLHSCYCWLYSGRACFSSISMSAQLPLNSRGIADSHACTFEVYTFPVCSAEVVVHLPAVLCN